MLEVFVTALVAFHVLFKHLDLTVLLLKLIFVITSPCPETVFEEVPTLLDICDFYSKGFKVPIKPRIVSNLFAIGSNYRIMDQCSAINSRTSSRFISGLGPRKHNVAVSERLVQVFFANSRLGLKLFNRFPWLGVQLDWRQRWSGIVFLSKWFLSWVSSIALTGVPQFWFPFRWLLGFPSSELHRKPFRRKPLGGTATFCIFLRRPPGVFKLLSHLFDSFLVILELLLRIQRGSWGG